MRRVVAPQVLLMETNTNTVSLLLDQWIVKDTERKEEGLA